MACLENVTKLSIFMIVILLGDAISADFTAHCPSACTCLWRDGNRVADCKENKLDTIPKNISTDIQILWLSRNPIYELMKDAFQSIGLSNLKKLYLKSCNLTFIHKDAFRTLKIMIELDLSSNGISTLDPSTFNDLVKLRVLNLNDNRLEKLEEGLFKDLEHLQKIFLSNNRIHKIAPGTFSNLPRLNGLDFSVNNLTTMKPEILQSLKSLSSVELHTNPWKCDCVLQPFRNFMVDRNLYTPPTSCAEPPELSNRLWNDLESSQFACRPNILDPMPTTIVQAPGENTTLSCKAYGNPAPDINWLQNERILYGDVRKHADQRYIIARGGHDHTRWVNLTIIHLKFHDRGDFTCVAQNAGGNDRRTVALSINRSAAAAGGNVSPSDYWLYMILIGVGAVFLVIFLFLITYCVCKRNSIKRHSKSDMHSSNGEALIEGSVIPEMEKSLITTVNPVTKPPRKYDAPSSIISGGTEMSELNKTLLDNESVYAPNEDESRSIDFAETNPKSSRDALSVTASNHGEHRTYPPDLLSFPPRGGQASPAASSASTAPDSSRLPPQQVQQSPLHSPIYGTNPNLYKTLTHSRSQSPFTSPSAPNAPARMGYVTIPRRPRVPSWGSTASYMTVTAPIDYVEPVYDNLGLRTTADGSSVLSLNKAGLEQQLSPGMRGRPLPSTPGSYQGPAPVLYAPIEEQDRAPSPAPSTPYSATMPRLSNNSFQFTPLEAEKKTPPQPKPRNSDDIYDIPKYLLRDGHLSPLSKDQIYDTPSANDALARSSGKIPPRPPPKPKKKNVNGPNGPLFEDEGEDGTEV